MRKFGRNLLCLTLALVMALSCLAVAPKAQAAGSFSLVGGWNESLYAEIEGVTDASVTAVSYSGAMTGQLTGQDLQFLVRDTASGVRIDIPGLKAGTYSLTVTAGGVTYSQSGIQVTAFDRSGFAHWNYTQGVGAYKDDGTVKDNAVIVYVTDENKNSVSVTAGGITVTGIGNILNTSGKASKNGGKANTNGDILKKLAEENRPLVVRIVGRVTQPAGVTAWGSYDYGGNPDDNGGMAGMQSCKNITIEGIGTDATVDGWGFSVGAQSGDYAKGYSRNFEFRNLTFKNVPEDCIGISGKSSSYPLTEPIEHTWVHNCAFFGPSNLPDASQDQDKAEGDGAVDYKWAQYHTMSYNYFEKYHKTHLIGGGDENLQYHVTWHHNHWKNCESRGPLGRQANMHVYNNLTEGQSSYCMSLRANCYIFSEYNTYINSKNISNSSNGGVCKSYMNTFTNCTGATASDIKTVTSKSQTVSSGNRFANFDTDASLGYIASGDYLLDEDAALAKANVLANAGPMDFANRSDAEEPSTPGETPTPSEGDYVHNFTESGLSSSFYTISGNLSQKGTVSYNGLTLTQCLKLESTTSVTFTAPSAGKLVLVFHETGLNGIVAAGCTVDLDGTRYTVNDDNTVTIPLAAGAHTLKRGDSQIFLYYMFYTPDSAQEHTHSYTETVTAAPTCTSGGVKTFACACGESYTEAIPATGHHYSAAVKAPSCTSGGYTVYACACGDSYVDDFTPAAGHSYSQGKCTVCGAADPNWHECSYTAAVTAPTCTAQGYTTYTCECGSSYVDAFVAATGHSYSAGACTVCGAADPEYVAPEAPKQGLHKADDGNYYYYIDGEIAEDFTGLVENSAGRWYVLAGQVQMSYDGLMEYEGTKYLIKAGHVNTAFTGITKQEGVYYYFNQGVNDLVFEGLVYCNGMKAYVQGGEVNFNKTGVVEDNGQLLYVKYGIWRNTYKGLARTDDGKWIYMANGTFDATYTGVAKLNANWVYVENGYVSSTFSGTVTVNGVDYTVKYGVVQF